MTQGARKTDSRGPSELGLVPGGVAGFVRSNALFMGLLTVLIAVTVLGIALVLPQQYSKQIVLAVTPVPTELVQDLGQPVLDEVQASTLAVEYLRNAGIDGVDVSPAYDVSTRQINVSVGAEDREALEGIGPRLAEVAKQRLLGVYEGPLAAALDARLDGLRNTIEVNRAAVESLEREAQALDDTGDPRALARLEGLESARAAALAEIARSAAETRNIEAALDELPRLTDEIVSAPVLSESETVESRSLAPVAVLALMLGLVGAVVAALIRAALRRSA